MAKMLDIHKDCKWEFLATDSGSNYTQAFEQALSEFETVTYILVAHASCDVAFTVTISDDDSGSTTTDLTALDCDAATKLNFYTITHENLTADKTYVSPKVTQSAGTYSLIKVSYNARQPGGFTQSTDVDQVRFAPDPA